MSCFACGEQASHRHHGGNPTCKACSSFFRRSIGHKRLYKCRFDQKKCTNRAPNKHGCQACRLNRCIEAGMEVSLIPFFEMPHTDGILNMLTGFWNANYVIRLQSLRSTGTIPQRSYFEFEKTISTCQGALLAEMSVMSGYIRNCESLMIADRSLKNEETIRAMFLGGWIAIEMLYRTVKNQGFEQRRVYFPDNSYLPVNEDSLFHYYNSFGIILSPEIVAREGMETLTSVLKASKRIFELKISEVEFSVCSYLILLKITSNLDKNNVSNYKKLLDKVFRELQIEYDNNSQDAALRIGDLILTLDLILNVKSSVERLLNVLSLHEKKSSNFFSAKVVEN